MSTELVSASPNAAAVPPEPSAAAPTAARLASAPRLSGAQKAAVVVRYLLAKGAPLSLDALPLRQQEALVRQMAELRQVDHATLQSVIEEFLASFDHSGLSFPGALEDALELLDGALGPEASARIRRRAGLSAHSDPWARIGGLDADALAELLSDESIEVTAVVLSKLKVSKSAEVLGILPGERARRIAYAMSLTGDVAPAVVRRIGTTIAEQLDAQPEREFSDGPVERVGAILNYSPSATREDVLDGLEKTDSEFASEVRRAIFTFANIPARIDPRDVPRITREVDPDQLIRALAAAAAGPEEEAEAAEFILSKLSQRMSGQLREDMEALGEIKPRDGEAAMTAVVAAIRELEAAGEILLVAEDE